MKRYDILPIEQNIKTSLETNSLGLNSKIFNTASFLDSLDCATTICLDGKWGSGKTFFVKELKLLLDNENDIHKEPLDSIKSLSGKPLLNQKYATVYFDAWENDFHQDPLLSLIYVIAKHFSLEYQFEQARIDEAVKNVLGSLVNNILKVDIQNILDGKYIDNFLSKIKEENDLQQKINDFFNSLVAEHGDRVLIIIDELDRCRPDYAIQLLERIKHYICCEQVTFLFAMNTSELENIIKQYYGQEFNATGYLDKFFDFRMSLPEVPMENYLQYLGLNPESNNHRDIATREIIKYLKFNKREINRFLMYQDVALKGIADWGRYNTALGYSFILIGEIIAPCMIGLKLKSSKLYSDFITGKDYSIVKYLLNREHFSFQKRTFFSDKQDQVQSEEKLNQEIEKFLDILFNFDFRGSICRQNVGGYEIDESCQRVVFSFVSMISEYSEFAN